MSHRDVEAGAALLVESLRDAGVTHIFANFGSDHPAVIEALARDRERGITTPRVIVCPHEYTALSAAHGYALATGQAQAVFVHTDVGTANLGGAVHNASRSKVPVFIFAGMTPYTLEGELPGSRNSHINSLQDAPDQHALVRQYVKWNYDLRTATNVPQIVQRSLQLARSAPAGPVYVTAAREVLAERAPRPRIDTWRWGAISPVSVADRIVDELVEELRRASFPLVVTSYVGRTRVAVARLVEVAERLGVGVVEYNPDVMNFPRDHPLHLGDDPHAVIAEADVIVVLDADVPWVATMAAPDPEARIYVINEDPLSERIPLLYVPADRYVRADSASLLEQILARAPRRGTPETRRRTDVTRARGAAIQQDWRETTERDVEAGRLTPESVSCAVTRAVGDDAIVLNEAISAAPAVWKNLVRHQPGTYYGNRGTSLGWSGGGAIGVKLAHPERFVVSIVGDGTFFFSVPSATYWIADQYDLPFLTIVLDNGGWNATKRNVLRQYQRGTAERTDAFWSSLSQSADFGGIASAAGDAVSEIVSEFDELDGALSRAITAVEAGRSAVVTVRLDPISRQPPEGRVRTSSA
ncbi:MAG TPA: thiamine pyrophosphate-requiring protein [Candidatus Microbacterium pullistercoris]|nr:thiamine pyrophosphate-requiring protein [Candidatus Microbacterium pullistercoris]